MFYSCIHMATVGVKWLTGIIDSADQWGQIGPLLTVWVQWRLVRVWCSDGEPGASSEHAADAVVCSTLVDTSVLWRHVSQRQSAVCTYTKTNTRVEGLLSITREIWNWAWILHFSRLCSFYRADAELHLPLRLPVPIFPFPSWICLLLIPFTFSLPSFPSFLFLIFLLPEAVSCPPHTDWRRSSISQWL